MRLKAAFLASAALVGLAVPSAIQAQVAGEQSAPAAANSASRVTTYDAAFFTQFAPRTALDIARRVPGFSLDLGNTDTRGFAGAAGNVVINGARPSSKAETLESTLSKIPARSVIRVEVGSGDLYGSEFSGRSQVLNVILSAVSGIDGNVTVAGRRLWTGYINRDISGSAQIKRGASTINLSAGTGQNKNIEEGTDLITDFATGQEIEFRRKTNSYFDRVPYLSGSWALERAPDSAFRANVRWSPAKFDLEQWNHVVPAAAPERDDSLFQRYRNPVTEIGGDITRPLAKGAIKFVGLATRRKRNNFDAYIQRSGVLSDNPTVVGGFEQTAKATQGETIGRATWTRADLGGFSFEAGIEAVLNTLDSSTELFAIGPTGDKTRIDLPIDQAKVKETRGEAYINVGKSLSPALRIDAGLNYEMSHLTVTGDTEANRSLKFLKPSISLDWKPGGGWHTRLSVRRTVAQLNFYDFISVAELSNDRVNAGNANLLPQRTWEVRATIDKPILGDGLFKLDLGVDQISMLQDQILILDSHGETFSAPGNIGTGKRSFIALTIDAPLAKLGLKGVRLKVDGQLQRTRVHDPISNTTRNFSDFFPDWNWNVDLRRDAGAFSYGITVQDRARFTFFRADETDTNWNGGPFGTAFVEYRPGPRTSITFDVDNLFDTDGQRERIFSFPNRSNPNPDVREFRERNKHVSFGITLKQTLGGAGGVAKSH
ncbi:outer membrane beta-barrel protein [Sphingomonas sp.]|uniref:outer membrane beta-barrel protein n=1 Tax=Sphingomonas sp. TaxID=28214 RepID=UPI00286BF53B|nr:outer membrane beta-barrel protein [Sphingomonas sp.]